MKIISFVKNLHVVPLLVETLKYRRRTQERYWTKTAKLKTLVKMYSHTNMEIFGNFWLVKLYKFSIYWTDVKLTCANTKIVFKGPSVISAIVPVWITRQWCISSFPSIMFLVSHLFRTSPKIPVTIHFT